MAESIPLFDKADSLTGKATAAVTGARFLRISGTPDTDSMIKVAHVNAAGGPVFGVSAHDAALGDYVGIHHQPALIVEVEAAGAITAGSLLMSDATGRATPYVAGAGVYSAGTAINDAAGGAKVLISRVLTTGA